jgi:hypothetical protein
MCLLINQYITELTCIQTPPCRRSSSCPASAAG